MDPLPLYHSKIHTMKKEIAMKKLLTSSIILLLALQGWINLQAQSILTLTESAGNCGLETDCATNTICLDIILVPGVSGVLLSYNIWLNYPASGLAYSTDNACITSNGGDNNLDFLGYYRVAGVSGVTTVTAGVPVAIHTICFTYGSLPEIDGMGITVGGSIFDQFHSAITFTDPPFNEPMLPEFPALILNSQTISCLLLPVKWLSFEAQKKEETALLDWSTGEEFNNKGFEVLRSSNGQSFEKIGWVDAKTDLASINKYQFIDPRPMKGVNYYRLKQVDLDSKYDYSPVRNLRFDSRNFAVSVTPNPADEFFFVEIQTEAEFSEIKLMDVTGRVVLSEKADRSSVSTRLQVDQLSPGLYTLVVESGIDRYVEPLVVTD